MAQATGGFDVEMRKPRHLCGDPRAAAAQDAGGMECLAPVGDHAGHAVLIREDAGHAAACLDHRASPPGCPGESVDHRRHAAPGQACAAAMPHAVKKAKNRAGGAWPRRRPAHRIRRQ